MGIFSGIPIDLETLTVRPEKEENICRVLNRFGREVIGWDIKNSMSSAYILSLYILLEE